MRTTRIILAIIIAATITSCCNMKSVTSLAQINGEWNVTEIEGKGLPESDSKPFIGFDALAAFIRQSFCKIVTAAFVWPLIGVANSSCSKSPITN